MNATNSSSVYCDSVQARSAFWQLRHGPHGIPPIIHSRHCFGTSEVKKKKLALIPLSKAHRMNFYSIYHAEGLIYANE